MAKICLICEGSYPYVVGGVSSWIQQLISSFSEHEFSIVCIVPDKEFINIKYTVPENVKSIKNIVLDTFYPYADKKIFARAPKLDSETRNCLKTVMDFKNSNSNEILEKLDIISKKSKFSPNDIVMSKDFWDVLMEYYQENHPNLGINNFYWIFRNIFLNLISLAKEELPEADIYHPVATGYSGFLAAMAAYRKKGNVILTEHGIYTREREEEILRANWIESSFKGIWIDYFYMLSKVCYDFSDVIVSLFDYNRNLQIENGAPESKCIVIPNGIDGDIYGNIPREKRPGFNIGSVTRIVPIKDVVMLLKGFKIAKDHIEDAHLYLIGPTDEDPKYYEECRELVKTLELTESVTFTGKQDVKKYYSFLDVLILSSLSEGQPLSILEGLAAGVPFIATDVGDCRGILLEKKMVGRAGSVVPPTSYAELAKEILKLYSNREKILEYGENGKEIVEKYYSKKGFIEKYRNIYEKLKEGEINGRDRI